ncbi:helix-turn-helix domain-containing protein [Sphingomonas sp. MMS24-J45]|uniref:helix-turn-helix domain-containing protein n=1 Tax=Sphingomonas sp. MMS24-J45 TaxID=3238806 RepID=UPI00384B09CA
MLRSAQTTITPQFAALAATAAGLVAGAKQALDNDPHVARGLLDQLATLFGSDERTRHEALLLPAAPPTGDERGTARGGLASWQVNRTLRYIDARLADPIMVETLASVAQLSTGHFCRAFKITVGETPHAFLIRQRVRRAQMLMLRTDETLSQIASACGLTDQAHLTRLFRRMVGETPLAWRRTWQPARPAAHRRAPSPQPFTTGE